jgi:hypothetical protein
MPENTSRSFLVRIWIEPREIPDQALQWRGMVLDVLSGERKYFKKFDEMIAFVVLQISMDIQKTKGPNQ